MSMEEIWKDIPGYEGLYQVNNRGRVKSLDRIRRNGGGMQFQPGQILKPSPGKNGYLHVGLSREGKIRTIMVHRLVALAFAPNPYGFPQVNHKDEDKTNNCADNLEWCTHRYNQNYGTHNKKVSASNMGRGAKAIIQLTSNGIFIREWPSFAEVERKLGIRVGNIWAALNGKLKQAGGYKWEYAKKSNMQNQARVKKGEKYWYIRIFAGLIDVDCRYDWDYSNDESDFEFGNYFNTKEEAEAMAEKIRRVLKGAIVLDKLPSEEEIEFECEKLLKSSAYDGDRWTEEAYQSGFEDGFNWLKSQLTKEE